MHPMIMKYLPDSIPSIPPILQGTRSLSILIGAGDVVHNGVTNVEQFSTYDILLCLPMGPGVEENISKLSDSGPVLCYIDVNSPQMVDFVQQFRGRFHTIDGHSIHIPHLSLETIEELLAEGGKATNIFEVSSSFVNIHTFLNWIKEEFINSYSNILMSTATVYSDAALTLSAEDAERLESVLREKIVYLNSVNKNVHLTEDILASLSSYRYFSLQKFFGSLLHDAITPLSLLGSVCLHCPAWDTEASIQLVMTKSSPMFWESILEDYIRLNGRTSHSDRAELIMNGVRSDMMNYMIWQSKAKYATFLRHMRKNILPFVKGDQE